MKKFLIAEDDRVSRFMLEGILRKWGYDVVATLFICENQYLTLRSLQGQMSTFATS